MPFKDYKDSPLMPFLLPIIPVGAKMSPKSKIEPERVGKIPGQFRDDGWVGFHNWPNHRNKKAEFIGVFDRWYEKSGCDPIIGIQAEDYPGIDVDCDLLPVIKLVKDVIESFYPNGTLVRTRTNSSRVLFMFRLKARAVPFMKQKMRFIIPGAPKPYYEIEFLGKGEQYLIEGKHPSGAKYNWINGRTPLKNPEAIAEIDGDTWSALFHAIYERLVAFGANFDLSSLGGIVSGSGNTTPERAVIGAEHFDVAPSLDDLRELLATFPCSHPDLADRDEWIKFLVAIKAAAGGDEQFFEDVVLPWCLEYADNTEEYVRDRWESFHDAALGWNYLLAFTQAENHEGIAKLFADDPNWAALADTDVSPPENTSEQRRNSPVPKLMPADFALQKLPRRQFVLGSRFMAGVVTLCVGPPGSAKSTLAILTALSIATGKRLTGEVVHRTGKIWIHNNEDSIDELYRRVGGMLKYHDIDFTHVRENIFVTSGLDARLVVAVKMKDIVEQQRAVAELINWINENDIIHMVVDPFVSTHRGVSENSNEEVEQVIECFRKLAHETGCSIDLIHHSLKPGNKTVDALAGDMNAARGASSLIGAVRMVYTVSPMGEKTATKLNVPEDQAARLVRLDHAKGNYSARDTRVSWFELESYNIGNSTEAGTTFYEGDTIAVPKPWAPQAEADAPQPGQDREAERRERLQRVRDFVAATMKTGKCKLMEILPAVGQQFVVKEGGARKLLKDAIPEGATAPAQADGCTYSLAFERDSRGAPHPITIVRTLIRVEAQAA